MFLLDTNVVSELRKPKPHGAVLAWIRPLSDADLFLSALTIGEIQAGIQKTHDQDPLRAAELNAWLDQVAAAYNVIPMDGRIFREWARLMHRRSDSLTENAMIAAAARVHNLTVVTRNVADFSPFDVPILDPFSG